MRPRHFTQPFLALVMGLLLLLLCPTAQAQSAPTATATNEAAGTARAPDQEAEVISRIRDEALNHSQVMETLSYLTEVIGQRLTGSPNLKRANEWTRDQLAQWGMVHTHLEAWGPFGRGWTLKRFSAQIVEPQPILLTACPNAWSPGLEQPLAAEVVHFDARSNDDLEKYKGKLRGAIVLSGPIRELKPHFEPLGLRLTESNLLQLANSGEPRGFGQRGAASARSGGPRTGLSGDDESSGATNASRSGSAPRRRFAGGGPRGNRFLSFLAKEGAALVVSPSFAGDGGTVFVAAASVPGTEGRGGPGSTNTPRVWATNAPAIPPQITLAVEDFNRLVRMMDHGEKLKMAVELEVQFHQDDLMAYNTIGEIPGSDLKDEVVMLGAHLDSWHSGTGATDNGVGVATTMEAMRILQALKIQPRRTIRLGLWTGEEQGLFGSRAYVAKHFGYYTNATETSEIRSPKALEDEPAGTTRAGTNSPPPRHLVRQPEFDKLSVYFNLDNGAGKIRGVYLQGNEGVRPWFRRWLEPFRDLEADTLSLSNTSGTDHTSFDAIGLPGFEFLQDPLEYRSRTHHSNEDLFDRVPPEDAKQASAILAAFAYDAAMAGEKLPRKPLAEPRDNAFRFSGLP